MKTSAILCLAFSVAACASKGPPPPATEPDPLPADDGPASGESLTATACEEQGGTVVGDIGDGAVLAPDYVCAETGAPPIGTIKPEEGGPIGVEGSVCCGPA